MRSSLVLNTSAGLLRRRITTIRKPTPMKKLLAFLALVALSFALAPVAEAGAQRRLAGYNQCGTAVYDTLYCVGHDRYGRPIHRWVRDRVPSGCTNPGRCRYHGHANVQRRQITSQRRISSPSIRHSQTHYVTPRSTVRSSFVRTGNTSRARSVRSTSSRSRCR